MRDYGLSEKLWRFTLTSVMGTVFCFVVASSASAFYFPNWPGAQVPQPKNILDPHGPQYGNPPSATTTIFPQEPPVTTVPPVTITSTNPPPSNPPPSNPPPAAPEPATILGSIVGLGVIGLYSRARSKLK